MSALVATPSFSQNSFGAAGQVTLAVSGGTGTYTYAWTHYGVAFASTKDIANLFAGEYICTITSGSYTLVVNTYVHGREQLLVHAPLNGTLAIGGSLALGTFANSSTTLGTATPTYAAGPYAGTQGLVISGTNQYLELPYTASLNFITQFSAGGWFYSDTSNTMFLSNVAATPAQGWELFTTSAAACLNAYSGGTAPALTGATTPALNTWTHWWIVYQLANSNDVTLYQNGVSVGKATPAVGSAASDMAWQICNSRRTGSGSYHMGAGRVADVRWYNGMVSPARAMMPLIITPGTMVTAPPSSSSIGATTVVGGTAPYTVLWTSTGTPITTQDLTAKAALTTGAYTVRITDANGISSTHTYDVAAAALVVTVTTVTAPTSVGNDGSITLSTTGGVGNRWGWTYKGSYYINGLSISGLFPGVYTNTTFSGPQQVVTTVTVPGSTGTLVATAPLNGSLALTSTAGSAFVNSSTTFGSSPTYGTGPAPTTQALLVPTGATKYLDLPYSGLLSLVPNSSISFGGWFFNTLATNTYLLANLQTVPSNTGVEVLTTSGTTLSTKYTANGTVTTGPSITSLPLNAWVHVWLASNGSTVFVYMSVVQLPITGTGTPPAASVINSLNTSTLVGSTPTSSMVASSIGWRLLSSQGSPATAFSGRVADVRWYSGMVGPQQALSALPCSIVPGAVVYSTGQADGSIASSTAVGGSGTYTSYVWTSSAGATQGLSATAGAKSGLLPGTYTLTVTDSLGATAAYAYSTINTLLLTAPSLVTDVTTASGSDGAIGPVYRYGFTTNQYGTVNQTVTVGSTFTFSTWVKITTAVNLGRIIDMNNGSGVDVVCMYVSNNVLAFESAGVAASSGFTPTVNAWFHVAITVNATLVSWYINGALFNVSTITAITSKARTAYFGKSSYAADPYFIGNLTAMRLWSVVRTTAQIAADYNTSLTGTETGLLFNYGNKSLRTTTVGGIATSMSTATSTLTFASYSAAALVQDTSLNWLVVTGGSGSYTTYTWSGTSTSTLVPNVAYQTGLKAGTYTCVIGDSLGATVTQVYTVNALGAVPTITASTTGVNGAISLSVVGGTGFSYTYAWTHYGVSAGTTQNLTGLFAGEYICTITSGSQTAVISTTVPGSDALLTQASLNGNLNLGGTLGLSGFVNSATTLGTPAYTTGPYTGTQALAISATTQYLELPYTASLDFITAFSVGGWFYTNSTGTMFIANPKATTTGGLELYSQSAAIAINYGSAGTQANKATTVNLNTWYHWWLVYDGSIVTLYQNGVSKGTITTSPAGCMQSLAGWEICNSRRFQGTYNMSSGKVADVRWYSGVVSPARAMTALVITPGAVSLASGTYSIGATTVIGGTAPYTAVWSTSSATTIATQNLTAKTGLAAGLYTVKVTDANLLSTTYTYNAPLLTVMVPSLVTNVATAGGSTGSIGPLYRYALTTNQYASVNQTLTVGPIFTIECWFNITTYNTYGRIFDTNNGPSGLDAIIVYSMNNGEVHFQNGTGTDYSITGYTAALNTWVHLAVALNGTSLKFYINGVAVTAITTNGVSASTATVTSTPTKARVNTWWGKSSYSNDPYLIANMTEMRLWSVERTAAQIAAAYKLTLVGNETGLVFNFGNPSLAATTAAGLVTSVSSTAYTMSFINYSAAALVLDTTLNWLAVAGGTGTYTTYTWSATNGTTFSNSGNWNFDINPYLTTTRPYSGLKSFNATSLTQSLNNTYPSVVVPALRFDQDFTIEAFVYVTNSPNSSRIQVGNGQGENVNSLIHGGSDSSLYQGNSSASLTACPAAAAMALNTWLHIGIAFQASTKRIYNIFNGGVTSAIGSATNIAQGRPINFFWRDERATGFYSTGYFDSVRVTQGLVYTAATYTIPDPLAWAAVGGSTLYVQNFDLYVQSTHYAHQTGLKAGTYTCVIGDSAGNSAPQVYTVQDPLTITSITPAASTTGLNGSITLVTTGDDGNTTFSWRFTGYTQTVSTVKSLTGLVMGSYYCVITRALQVLNTGPVIVSGILAPTAWTNQLPIRSTAQAYSGSKSFDMTTLTKSLTTYPRLSVPSLSYQKDFTIEGFIYPTGLNTNAVMGACSAVTGAIGDNVGWTNTTLTIYYGATGATVASISLGSTLTLNVWHHVAISYDAVTNTMYTCWDGLEKHSTALTLPLTLSPNSVITFLWRSDSAATTTYQTGYLDSVRVSQMCLYKRSYVVPNPLTFYTSGNTCLFSDRFEDLVVSPGTITAATNDTTANGSIGTLIVTGGTPPYTYAWTNTTRFNSTSSSNVSGVTSSALTSVLPGTYTVTVTDSAALSQQVIMDVPATAAISPWWNIALPITAGAAYTGTKGVTTVGLTQSLNNTFPALYIPALDYQGSWTIEFFAQSPSVGHLMCMSNGSSGGADTVYRLNSQQCFYRGTANTFIGSSVLTANVWSHVAVCFDATTNTLYATMNGRLDKVTTTGPPQLDNGKPICFFWRSDSNASYTAGFFDNVRVTQSCLYRTSYMPIDPLTWIASAPNTLYVQDFEDIQIIAGTVAAASTYTTADGSITGVTATNGTAPYTFAWTSAYPGSNVSSLTSAALTGLLPAVYTVTATDSTGKTCQKRFTVGYTVAPAYFWNMALPITTAQAYTGTKCLNVVGLTQSATFTTYPSLTVPALIYSQSFTVECWVRPVNLTAVIGLNNNFYSNNEALVLMGTTFNQYKQTNVYSVASTAPANNVWTHVAISYDATTTIAYGAVNGSVVSLSNGALTYLDQGKPINFMHRRDVSNYSTGYIDNIRVSQACLYSAAYTVPNPSGWAVGGTTLYCESFDVVPIVLTGGAVTNATINGASNGSITAVVPTGGNGVFTYAWSSTGTSVSSITTGGPLNNVAAGTYTLIVTDSVGSTNTGVYTVTQPLIIIITAAAITNNTVNGGTNGSIGTTTVSGGSGTYSSTVWTSSGGGTTGLAATLASKTGLKAGTYTLVVTDNAGATATYIYTLVDPPVVTITPGTITNNTVNGGTSGSIGATTVSGGSGTYSSYVWTSSNGGTTGLAATLAAKTGLTAGTYTLVVTDSAGATATKVYTLVDPLPLTVASPSLVTGVAVAGGSTGTIGPVNTLTLNGSTQYGIVSQPCSVGATITVEFWMKVATIPSSYTRIFECFNTSADAITLTVLNGFLYQEKNWTPGVSSGYALTLNNWVHIAYAVTGTTAKFYVNGALFSTVTIGALTVTSRSTTYWGNCYSAVEPFGGTLTEMRLWSVERTAAQIAAAFRAPLTGTETGLVHCFGTRSLGAVTSGGIVYDISPNNCTMTIAAYTAGASVTNNSTLNWLAPSGGSGTYVYTWSGTSTSTLVNNVAYQTGLKVGTYTCVIGDSAGATATQQVYTVGTALAITPGTVVPGTTTGAIGATTVTGAYTSLLWISSGTGATTGLSGLAAQPALAPGTYTLVVRDSATGSVAVYSYVVTTILIVTPLITASSTGTNGAITLSVSGGTGTNTYFWTYYGVSTGSNNQTLSGLFAGEYSCTVASGTQTVVVNVTVPGSDVLLAQAALNGSLTLTGSLGLSFVNPTTTLGSAASYGVGPFTGTQAINMATASYLILPYTAALNNSSPFSFGCWVYISGFGAQTTLFGNVAGTNNTGLEIYVNTGPSTPALNVFVSGANYAATTNTSVSTIPNTWVHFCLVYDGTLIKVYQNGTLCLTSAATTPQSITTTVGWGLKFTRATASAYPWSGKIADARWYSGVVSPQRAMISLVITPGAITTTSIGATTVLGGTAPYAAVWTSTATAITTQDLTAKTGLAPGFYTVKVTDANALNTTFTYQVAALFVVTPSTTPATIGNNGTISLAVSGGTGVNSFAWTYYGTNFSTAQNLTGLFAGTYTCTATSGTQTQLFNVVVTGTAGALLAQATLNGSLSLGGSLGLAFVAPITTLGGAPTYTTSGPLPGTVGINLASTFLQLPYHASLNFTNAAPFSFGCWIYQTSTPDSHAMCNSAVGGIEIEIWASGSNVTLGMHDTGGGRVAYVGNFTMSSNSLSKWRHYWVVYNGDSMYLYVDSVLLGSSVVSTASFTSSTGWLLGKKSTKAFTGAIADARWYSGMVSPLRAQAPEDFAGTVSNCSYNGIKDGSISAPGVAFGTAPFTYSWSDSSAITTAVRTGLGAGTYVCTIRDAASAIKQYSYTVTQPAALSIVLTQINSTGSNNGSISASSASGGTSPYTYAWNTGATTAGLSNLVAGSYTLTMTDARSYSITKIVNLTAPATFVPSPSSVQVSWPAGTNSASRYRVQYSIGTSAVVTTFIEGTAVTSVLVTGLVPVTSYTFYISESLTTTTTSYAVKYTGSATTLAASTANYTKSAFKFAATDTVYQLSAVTAAQAAAANTTKEALVRSVFSTNDAIVVQSTSKNTSHSVTASVVRLAESIAVKRNTVVYLPFDPTDSVTAQGANLVLTDASVLPVTYNAGSDQITVNGIVYKEGDVFYTADGQQVTVTSST